MFRQDEMKQHEKPFMIQQQLRKLYVLDGASALMIAGASWVALLAARGFSTLQIGIWESIFHVASMCFEVPSGAIADVFGRKKTMVASRVMNILASILMIVTSSPITIAFAMIVNALSYNLASGTREALAFDSLKEAGKEEAYDRFAANDMVIYQICSSAATLLAGAALYLGYQKAYAVDIVIGVMTLGIALSLREADREVPKQSSIRGRFLEVAAESIGFLKDHRRARRIILINAVSGAVSMLVLFFLQAKLPQLGLSAGLLGPALFLMGMGAAAGAKLSEYLSGVRFGRIVCCAMCGVGLAFGAAFSGNLIVMITGGFLGAFADNCLAVRSDVVLNRAIPSAQRATLMSVNSFVYSVVMIVLSPIFGWLFT